MAIKKEYVYIAGAVGAFLILSRSKTGATSPLKKLSSAIGSLIPKGMQRPTTTNLATGYGTRVNPVGPSSGIGYNPRTAANPAVNYTPVTAGILGGASVLDTWLRGIFSRPNNSSMPSQTTTPRQQGSGSGGGGGFGGAQGGTGTTGRPTAPSAGGFMGSSPTPNGFYDGNGNWVATDADGNILKNPDGSLPGYYDANGNYVPYDTSYGGGTPGDQGPAAPVYGGGTPGDQGPVAPASPYGGGSPGDQGPAVPDDSGVPAADPASPVDNTGATPPDTNADTTGTATDTNPSNNGGVDITDPYGLGDTSGYDPTMGGGGGADDFSVPEY